MAEQTAIQWTDHTANFWWGCMKVSPGCAHCYAETLSKRYGRAIWGPAATTERWRTKGPWRDILRWDARAAADGVRRRVFAQSMSDFFEEHPQLDSWREEACEILAGLKHMDVQLLTKRPENVRRMVPPLWLEAWPAHIWIGTSVENQEMADRRIPMLLEVPATVRFLSCEPLLGPLDLAFYIDNVFYDDEGDFTIGPSIEWVIVGGESGPKARPMNPDWARDIRDLCQDTATAFHFKQHGEWLHHSQMDMAFKGDLAMESIFGATFKYHDWPDETRSVRVGRKRAGRLLDGREWNEYPATSK